MDVTGLPKRKTLVGYKWIFTIRYKVNGTIERYKVRMVSNKFTQTYEIDDNETFAPVVRLNTVWVLLF